MRARAPASPETRPASVTAGVRAGRAARLSRSRDIRGSNACRMLSADGQRRPGAGSVAAITQRDFTRRPGGGEFAPAESERMPYRRIANGRPSIPPCYARLPPDGPRPMAARAGGHRRTDAGRRLFDHASGGEAPTGGRSRSHGPPARRRSDEPREGGGAQFRRYGCGQRGGEARAAVPRDVPGLLLPGAARLRCPGERNGACRWLRPVRKSSDALIRAVRMSRGRGRRSRGTAGCRTRWPGSRIWR